MSAPRRFTGLDTIGHAGPIQRRYRAPSRQDEQLSWCWQWPSQPAQPRAAVAHGLRSQRQVILAQAELCFAAPVKLVILVITPLMAEVERLLQRVVSLGEELPGNVLLGQMAGGRPRPSIARAISKLERAGHITMQIEPLRRRVVLADGRATAWRIQHVGHAPYSARPRGSAAPIADLPARQPPNLLRADLDCRRHAIVLTPVTGCQWPLWGDGEKPSYRYCDAPTPGRRSWCPLHDPCRHVQNRIGRLAGQQVARQPATTSHC